MKEGSRTGWPGRSAPEARTTACPAGGATHRVPTASSLPEAEDGVWQLATALSAATTSADVSAALADRGAGAAGAAFDTMALLDEDGVSVRLVHRAGADPIATGQWDHFEIADDLPPCDAMRTGLPVLLETRRAMAHRYPHAVGVVPEGLAAFAALPLVTAAGRPIGAVCFAWSSPQPFGVDQLRRLDLVVRIAAQSLERAQLHERQHREVVARERADAQLLQEAFLPRDLPQRDDLELAAVYLPASGAAMGGDWYDAFAVGRRMCLVVGDVAGHGREAAAVMAQLRNTVRAYAHEDPSPATIVTRLNRMTCRLLPGETATAVVAVWDPDTGTVMRSSAGHLPVLRYRVGEFGYLPSAVGGLMLGVDPDYEYGEEPKVLRHGTTLLFYTDGLVELPGRSLGDGLADLQAHAEQCRDLAPRILCEEILDWRCAAARIDDDVCLLAARLTPPRP